MIKSCFRYPGAKTKLLPNIDKYFSVLLNKSISFVDLFVGGGSVSIFFAQKFPQHKIYLNDKDDLIYSFWSTVVGSENDFNRLCNLLDCKPTIEFYNELKTKSGSSIDNAFKALFFNRTNFSGMLHSNPIGGKNQDSKYKLDCRYNSIKIIQNLKDIRNLLLNRTVVSNDDVTSSKFLYENLPLYLDPPYFHAGKSLYPTFMSSEDHVKLAYHLNNRRINFVLSYDNCDEIKSLYKDFEIIEIEASYTTNSKRKTTELIINGR